MDSCRTDPGELAQSVERFDGIEEVAGAKPAFSTTFNGHEEDSNPRGSDPRDTRGSTGVPDHFSNQ